MRELHGPDCHKARKQWLSKNKPSDLSDLKQAALHDGVAISPECLAVLSACLQVRSVMRYRE